MGRCGAVGSRSVLVDAQWCYECAWARCMLARRHHDGPPVNATMSRHGVVVLFEGMGEWAREGE